MHFVWESPGRLLLAFAVDVRGVSCQHHHVGWGCPNQWYTLPALGPLPHHGLLSSSKSTIPRRHLATAAAENTRNAESILTPSRLVMNPPAAEVTLLERELQSFGCLCKISMSFPSSPTKEESLVTSWAADKQVQVLSTVPLPRRSFGIWFSTKHSGGSAQGVAGKEIRNKQRAHTQSTSLQLWAFTSVFPSSLSPPPLLTCCSCAENWWTSRRNQKSL